MKFKQVDGGKYLKLNDGESVTGVFLGDPYEFHQHFVDGKGVLCTEACQHCGNGVKPTFRFSVNFVNTSDMSVKVFDQGKHMYKQLQSLDGTLAPLEKTLVRITRTGVGIDTRYVIEALSVLSPEIESKLRDCFLHRLEPKNPYAEYTPGPLATQSQENLSAYGDFKDIPF